MKLLELFCGTKSVSNAYHFDEVISIDILDKFKPTIKTDILEWDYRSFPKGYFDVIWASPPCTEYSRLKQNTGMHTNLEQADRIVLKTLEIIEYFKPKKWFMENPQTGLLKSRPFMQQLKYYDYDYCSFSDWGYKKRTRIWTNQQKESILCKKDKCPNMVGKYHKASFGGQGRDKPHTYVKVPAGMNAYRIPPALIVYLISDNTQ